MSQVIVNFISGIILARLLSPDDYGMLGMLAIFILLANTFIDGGFGFAIIQKKNPTEEDYSTVFYWNVGLAIVLYIILYVCAPLIAGFYRVSLLSEILRVSGITLIINALRVIHECILKKRLKFKKLAIASVSSSVLSLSIAIWMAYNGYGVWSLVIQNLLLSGLPTIVYWLTDKWLPKLVFSIKSFKELFSFGLYVLMNTFASTFVSNIQGLLIGRLYNPALMGYYSKAHSTENLASNTVSLIVRQVAFPVFAELQDKRDKLILSIRKLTTTMSFVCFPMLFLLILLAKPLFILLYSVKWIESVPYFQILCVAGLAICLQSINTRPLLAIGKSKIYFYWGLVKQVIGLALIVGGLMIGEIWGMLIGMVISAWLSYMVNAALVSKYIGYSMRTQAFDIFRVLSVAMLSYGVAYALGVILPFGMYVVAIIQLIVFVILYLVVSHRVNRTYMLNVWEFISPLLAKFKR